MFARAPERVNRRHYTRSASGIAMDAGRISGEDLLVNCIWPPETKLALWGPPQAPFVTGNWATSVGLTRSFHDVKILKNVGELRCFPLPRSFDDV